MSKAKRLASTLKNDGSDRVVSPKCASDSDQEIDWSTTARCTREWSDDELLSNLCSKAFTIPPRDYNPSAPFVYARTEDGVITTLPHGYRLPLMFIAKYQWETTTRALSLQNRERWVAARDEILHLSRLCHTILLKARAKAESSGMEKGWRCVMFDRVLTRFYKGWPVSSPDKLESFLSHFGHNEYERDVLKHDWKRWVLKGFFRESSTTIRLTEEDVNDGITAVDLKMRLSKIDNVWTLSSGTKNDSNRQPIKFMQSVDYSSSELTDVDDLDVDDDDDDDEPARTFHNPNPNFVPPFVPETLPKRSRESSEDDNTNNRSGKKAKLEEIIRSLSQPCTPIPMADGFNRCDSVDQGDSLPKFRVPRQTLHSHGWKRLSAMDGLARRCQREEELGADVVPITCSLDISGPTSTAISVPLNLPRAPPNQPTNDSSSSNPSTSLSIAPTGNSIENALEIIPPALTSISQKGKTPVVKAHLPASVSAPTILPSTPTSTVLLKPLGKQPKSAFASPVCTPRKFRNSAYVSIPSSSRPERMRLDSSLGITPPPESTRFPVIARATDRGVTVIREKQPRVPGMPLAHTPTPLLHTQTRSQTQKTGRAGGASYKGKEKIVKEEDSMKNGIENSAENFDSSSIQPSAGTVDPKRSLAPNCSDVGSASAPPSSLAPSTVPALPTPDGSAAAASAGAASSNSGADTQIEAQDWKGRFLELETRFLGLKDGFAGVVGRLEVLEGVKGGDGDGAGDGNLGRGGSRGGGGGSNSHPDFISQPDVDMMAVSESGTTPRHVDAVVRGSALAAYRDVSVQAGRPARDCCSVVASGTAAVQTVDPSSASLLEVEQMSNTNLGNINPKHLEPKSDQSFAQFMNATSLSTIVDNLISVKMLSMMQSLVKSSIGGNNNGKEKLVETTTTTTHESDSDVVRQPSPSTSLSISASHSIDAYDNIMASLLDELKTIKEEIRCREQNEKEDLLAMRQLHSAEVDALRRRLSYLESKNLTLGRWETGNNSRWRRDSPSKRVDSADSLDMDRHHQQQYHQQFLEDDHRASFRQRHGDGSQTCHLQNGLDRRSSSSSTVNPGGESTSNTTSTATPQSFYFKRSNPSREVPAAATDPNAMSSLPTPTPLTPSERNYSFGFSKNGGHGMDLDDDLMKPLQTLPLPIKSQRKHHMMALARAHPS